MDRANPLSRLQERVDCHGRAARGRLRAQPGGVLPRLHDHRRRVGLQGDPGDLGDWQSPVMSVLWRLHRPDRARLHEHVPADGAALLGRLRSRRLHGGAPCRVAGRRNGAAGIHAAGVLLRRTDLARRAVRRCLAVRRSLDLRHGLPAGGDPVAGADDRDAARRGLACCCVRTRSSPRRCWRPM